MRTHPVISTTTADFQGFVTELLRLAQHADTTLGELVADISGDEAPLPTTASNASITEVHQAYVGHGLETFVTLDNGSTFALAFHRV